jgi:diguanylate cyclase (GGDEF)-like protein
MQIEQRASLASDLDLCIQDCIAADTPLAVMVIKLGRLRELSNSYGYDAAEAVVSHTGERLRSMLRARDRVHRIGNDEWLFVMRGLKNPAHATLAANKTLSLLGEPFPLAEKTLSISARIGIATLTPASAQSGAILLQQADIALTRALANNIPYVVHKHSDQDALQTLTLENELADALQENELELVYQPKMDLSTHQVVGVEALVRWHNKLRGPISPSIFVPLAERSGVILPFTRWTLNTACRQAKEMREALETPIKVSINIAANILQSNDVVDMVTHSQRLWDAQPGELIIEVTESAMMVDPQRSLETLERLHRHGIGLSVDDFGTGYSSLAYLKKIPLSEIKIDRSFINNIVSDSNDETIVGTVINMAHNFGLLVTGEGIEDQTTQDKLASMGCDIGQGYHIARPMAATAFINWMRAR